MFKSHRASRGPSTTADSLIMTLLHAVSLCLLCKTALEIYHLFMNIFSALFNCSGVPIDYIVFSPCEERCSRKWQTSPRCRHLAILTKQRCLIVWRPTTGATTWLTGH